MRALTRAFLACSLLLALPASPASAEEQIAAFGSTVFVKQDGTLDVVERIWVDAENVSIRHGIYRDFPTRYTIPNGGRMKVGFTFVDAKLDGQPVEHDVENLEQRRPDQARLARQLRLARPPPLPDPLSGHPRARLLQGL